MAERHGSALMRQVDSIVAGALRSNFRADRDAGLRPDPMMLWEAMALEERGTEDCLPPRRRGEYVRLPKEQDILRERGLRFLENIGIEVPPAYVSVINRDDMLEININDSTRDDVTAQVTLTVARKGEAVAASLGEFLQGMGIRHFLEHPAELPDLAEQGMNLSGLTIQALEDTTTRPPFWIRDTYELGDGEDSYSLTRAMHLLETAGEVCTTRRVRFAAPLLAISTNVRTTWPYQGATSGELLVISDAVPEGYANVVDVMENSTSNEVKSLTRVVGRMKREIQEKLAKKRGLAVPLDVPEDEVYSDGKGHYYIVAFGFDVEGAQYERQTEDDDDGELASA